MQKYNTTVVFHVKRERLQAHASFTASDYKLFWLLKLQMIYIRCRPI